MYFKHCLYEKGRWIFRGRITKSVRCNMNCVCVSDWKESDGRESRRRGHIEAMERLLQQVRATHQHYSCGGTNSHTHAYSHHTLYSPKDSLTHSTCAELFLSLSHSLTQTIPPHCVCSGAWTHFVCHNCWYWWFNSFRFLSEVWAKSSLCVVLVCALVSHAVLWSNDFFFFICLYCVRVLFKCMRSN